MKRNTIVSSHLNIVVSLSDIRRERERACSPFGPVRAGLITLQITHTQQRSVLHSSSVKIVENQISKSLEDLDTSQLATITQLVGRLNSTLDTTTTDVVS